MTEKLSRLGGHHVGARRRADRHLHPAADAADRCGIAARLVDAYAVRHGQLIGLDNFRDIFGFDLDRSGFQGRIAQHRALHGDVARADPAAVGGARLDGLPTDRCRRDHASDRAVFHLHGADDRRGAGMVEALFANRRAAEPVARADRPRAITLAVVAKHRASVDRVAERLAAGRLFHRTRRRRPDGRFRAASIRQRSSKAQMPGSSFAPSRCR